VRIPTQATDWLVRLRSSLAHSPLLCVSPSQPMGRLSETPAQQILFQFKAFICYSIDAAQDTAFAMDCQEPNSEKSHASWLHLRKIRYNDGTGVLVVISSLEASVFSSECYV